MCVAAMDRRAYYESALTIVRTWMLMLNVRCTVSRFYPGLDGKADVVRREDYLKNARGAGVELIRSAQEQAER